MEPQSDTRLFDRLKEKFYDLCQHLREILASGKPAQTPVTALKGIATENLTEPNPYLQAAKAEVEMKESPESPQPKSDRAFVDVTIGAKIPQGTKLTITVQADKQGQVSDHQQSKPARPAMHDAESKPGGVTGLQEHVTVFKTSLAKLTSLPSRMSVSLAKVDILRNGLFFCILAIFAAIIADNELRTTKAFTQTAVFPLLLAGFLFTWGTWAIQLNGAGILDDALSKGLFGLSKNKQRSNIALGLISVALMLTYWVSLDSVSGEEFSPFWMLLRWGIAILLVCVAIWQIQAVPKDKSGGAQSNKWLVIGVIILLLLAFGLRIWQLSSIPYTLGGDEGEQGTESLRVLSGDLRNPFITGWYGVPTFSFFFNAFTVALFGNTIFGLRLMWVLVGTASILVTYLLVKELKGTRMALIVAVLVTTYHYHIHFSRLGSNQISDTLLVGLTLLFLVRGYLRGKWLDWALAGVVAGIAQYFYAGGRLAVILVLFLVAFFWVRDGFKMSRVNWIGLGIFLVALLVAGGPMISFAVHFPDDYNARANQVGILQSGWLENEAQKLGTTQGELLLDQFKRAALAFNAYPDRIVWYGLESPLLDRVSGILFLVGIVSASFWSLRDRRLAPMVAWWWAAILTGGMLTLSTPQSQRLITASIPTMFFVAWAIEQISTAINQQAHKWFGLSFSILTLLLISVISINLYFVEFTPKRIYGGPHAFIGTIISENILQEPGPDPEIYFFGAPRMYAGIGTMRYLIPDVTKIDIHTPLEGPFEPDPFPEGQYLLFVFLPERLNELVYVKQSFPGGQIEEVTSPVEPEKVIYITYTVR